MICIYDALETDFTRNGFVSLSPASCVVSEALNGDYRLEMTYPIDDTGVWEQIVEDRILRVRTHKGNDAFRIYRVGKDMARMIDVYARHISYDLATSIIEDRYPTNTTSSAALQIALADTGFSGVSYVQGMASARWIRKVVLAAIMGEEENSIVNRWGGEVDRRLFNVNVLPKMGGDDGVQIRYRKNLTGLQVDVDISGVRTRVLPTGLGEDGQSVIKLPELYIDSPLIGNYAKIRAAHQHYGDIKLDPEGEYPTLNDVYDALRARVIKEYADGLDKPAISAKVSFVDLSKTDEYKQYKQLEGIGIGDTVYVYHPEIKVMMSARVVSVRWNCLTDQYDDLTLGQENVSLSTVINNQNSTIRREAAERSDALQTAIDDATALLTSPGDSYVRFIPSISNPSEILIMDAPTPEAAVEVLRLNRNGWGLSASGVNGPYITAATGSSINAGSIKTGELDAVQVKITSRDSRVFIDGDGINLQKDDGTLIRVGIFTDKLGKAEIGIAWSNDGGDTWQSTIQDGNIYIGDHQAGFDLSQNGLTNGDLIQLLANGTIKLSWLSMVSGDNPSFTVQFNDNRAFHIEDGATSNDQIFYQNGPMYFRSDLIYFTNLGRTSLQPNLYIEPSTGRPMISDWTPPKGDGTDPGTGPGTGPTPPPNGTLTAYWNQSTVTTGGLLYAIVTYTGWTPNSFTFRIYLTGNLLTQSTEVQSSRTVAIPNSGTYTFEVEATDGTYTKKAVSTGAVASPPGGGGGGTGQFPKAGQTVGTQVNMRSGAGTTYSIVTTIAASGTAITITGNYVSGSDGYSWWPVSYAGYTGYIRSTYVLVSN